MYTVHFIQVLSETTQVFSETGKMGIKDNFLQCSIKPLLWLSETDLEKPLTAYRQSPQNNKKALNSQRRLGLMLWVLIRLPERGN